jgi:hypothetical protein
MTAMAALLDDNVSTASTSNSESPPWAREVAASLVTRPSRASSLVSTRTKFSTTTFQEDAKSIDLSISGRHFRISRDGSKVTSINHGESLPPYPFNSVHESLEHDRIYHRYASSDPGSTSDFRNARIEDGVESQAPVPYHSSLAFLTAYMRPANCGPDEADDSLAVLPSGTLEHSEGSDQGFNGHVSGLGDPPDKTTTLTSMAVRIQRAWRNYVQYRSPSSKLGESTNFPIRTADHSRTVAQDPFIKEVFRQQNHTSPPLPQIDAIPVSVPAPKKSVSFLDKDLPIPDEAASVAVGSQFLPSITRRSGPRDLDRRSLATPSRSQSVVLPMVGSTKVRSTNQRYKPVFPEADGRESAEQLSLRKCFTGEDSRRFQDTDEPGLSPAASHPPKAMDSENDVSNHYTRMIRFIDRDHRRALHARDKEMAELRERLNEKDIVYRQELRARDFLIEDLKKRLEHMEETTETEIERARNQVEDTWESRWKDRDFHLRERMQRMESEMQKTTETTIAEREAFWKSKYEELRRRLDIPEGLADD